MEQIDEARRLLEEVLKKILIALISQLRMISLNLLNSNHVIRIALGVDYEGSNYFGFQKQKATHQTIQGHLESSISKVADQEVKTYCSGRTDAGVHALLQ